MATMVGLRFVVIGMIERINMQLENFRPMKPYKLKLPQDLSKLRYPLLVQPKLDGFRCVILDGKALSYSLKPIRNNYTREWLEFKYGKENRHAITFLDGELLVNGGNFQAVQSAFNSYDGEPDFCYKLFDGGCFTFSCESRITGLEKHALGERAHPVMTTKIYDEQELLNYETTCLAQGYEGIILRDPVAHYKFGRSSLRSGELLAIKRFTDAEAEILGCYALERNLNEPTINEHGLQERSSAASGKVLDKMLGGFNVRGINGTFKDVIFNIGSGFTEAQRIQYWQQWKANEQLMPSIVTGARIISRIVKYKYQECGSKDKPRSPIFLGFRHEDDL